MLQKSQRFETETYTAPAHWASYLFNGDASGIDEQDIMEADAFLESVGLGWPAECSQEPEFRNRMDFGRLAGDALEYTFLRAL